MASIIAADHANNNGMTLPPIVPKKRNPKRYLGRSARRRQQKLEEIQLAANRLLQNPHSQGKSTKENTSTAQLNSQVIPSDRGIIWPGVVHRRNPTSWDADAAMLLSQLGYIPGNAIRVAARVRDVPFLANYSCHDQEPVVLQLYPLALRHEHTGGKANRKFKQRKRTKQQQQQQQIEQSVADLRKGASTKQTNDKDVLVKITKDLSFNKDSEEDEFVVEPFPTIYWLTHPLLRILISKMELQGMGIQLEQELKEDSEALMSIQRANRAYGQDRYNLLTTDDLDYIKKRNWEGAFDPNRGVAGIRNFASVKCLVGNNFVCMCSYLWILFIS